MNTSLPIIVEIGSLALFLLAFYAGLKMYGREKVVLFFVGSLFWSGLPENFFVLIGGYDYYVYANIIVSGYPGFSTWIGFVPLWVCLGWFIIAMSSFIIVYEFFMKERGAWFKAVASGFFAVNLDMLIDPVSVANGFWRWTQPSVYLLNIPLVNLISWFLLVSLYTWIFNTTVIEKKSFKLLSRLEKTLFKVEKLSDENFGGVVKVFFVRLVLLDLFVMGIIASLLIILIPFSNFSPPESVFPLILSG